MIGLTIMRLEGMKMPSRKLFQRHVKADGGVRPLKVEAGWNVDDGAELGSSGELGPN